MSDAARRKEKKRLKREKKRAEQRRAMAGSPYKRIAQVGPVHACYITEGWQTCGMSSIHFMRVNPQGGFAMACFLIDFWCAGLKEAWGSLDMHKEDIDWHLEKAQQHLALERIDPEAARQLVAGAIRYARQNGFRLPAHYERWVNLLGEIPAPATADLRPFGKDGEVCWVGTREDLQKRLIGCTAEEFLHRRAANFIMPAHEFMDESELEEVVEDTDEEEDEETLSELERRFDEIACDICEEAIENCDQAGETPSPAVFEAAKSIVSALLVLISAGQAEFTEDDVVAIADGLIEETPDQNDAAGTKAALRQIFRVLPESRAALAELSTEVSAAREVSTARQESPSPIRPIDGVPEIP